MCSKHIRPVTGGLRHDCEKVFGRALGQGRSTGSSPWYWLTKIHYLKMIHRLIALLVIGYRVVLEL
jgi:hypothetical protein